MSRKLPDVQAESRLVDAAAMDLVRRPERFDVLVASNLFGDILTDLSAMVTGSVGLAASGAINPVRTFPSMGIANPLAAILSGVLMLERLGLKSASDRQHGAVKAVLKEGKALTLDLGGAARTGDATAAVMGRLR